MNEALYTSAWQSPSNIALVKYWGKYGDQLPCNASVSFTLDECHTRTEVSLFPKESSGISLEIYLDGERKESFEPKIFRFFEKIAPDFGWLSDYDFRIHTSNSFPHSSGIASSASGISAIALAICDLHQKIKGILFSDFYRKASYYSRMGSGSACRSVYGGLVLWGQHEAIAGSSQEYALPYPEEVHPVYTDFCDTVLLVHRGSKDVSSTAGHGLMKDHPFAEARFIQAQKNISRIKGIFKSGDLEAFAELVESEALMLHALMMSSVPYFMLMKPHTLSIIEKIWDFRKQNRIPVLFTLDAGANVHLLYPRENKVAVEKWVAGELAVFCENKAYICGGVGSGPQKMNGLK
jgi:diphosphomevalonate decarboxylase